MNIKLRTRAAAFGVTLSLAFVSHAFAMSKPAPTPSPSPSPTSVSQDQLNALLIQAVMNQKADDVRTLLKQGASPDAEDSYQRPAVTIAAAEGSLPVVQALVEGGANVNTTRGRPDLIPLPPLEYWRESLDVMDYLLDHGADPNLIIPGFDGMSVFLALFRLHACDGNKAKLERAVRAFLSHGARLKAIDNQGNGALFDIGCIWDGYHDPFPANIDPFQAAVEILLKAGLNINETSKSGLTPLLSLIVDPSDQTADLIDYPTELKSKVQFLVEKGAKLSALDRHGNNAIILAASRPGRSETLDYLLSTGKFDVNSRNYSQETAAMLVAEPSELVVLMNHGACLNLMDSNGNTALSLAISRGNVELSNVIRVYLKQGISKSCRSLERQY